MKKCAAKRLTLLWMRYLYGNAKHAGEEMGGQNLQSIVPAPDARPATTFRSENSDTCLQEW
jgi:hypothetical protein